MRLNIFSRLIATLLACTALPCLADPHVCKNERFELSAYDSGAFINGPKCVVLPVNSLRYDAALGLSTVTTYPNINPFDPGGSNRSQAALSAAAVDDSLSDAAKELDDLETAARKATAQDDGELRKTVAALQKIRMQVLTSDSVFLAEGAAGVRKRLDDSNFKTVLAAATQSEDPELALFQTADKVVSRIERFRNDMTRFRNTVTSLNAAQVKRFETIFSKLDELQKAMQPYLSNGTTVVEFQKQQSIFMFWSQRIEQLLRPTPGMAESYWEVRRNVECHTFGNETKKIGVKVIRTDLLPLLSGEDAKALAPSEALITVNCPSTFTLSGGLALSFLQTNNYGIVPGASGAAPTYGITHTTAVSAMPVAMVHARVMETRNHKLGFQIGTGVAAHTQSDTAGGTGAEYLLGAGLALYRTVYLTPSWQFGRVASLSRGYSVGDTAAAGATAALLVSHYASGFSLAITFTKP